MEYNLDKPKILLPGWLRGRQKKPKMTEKDYHWLRLQNYYKVKHKEITPEQVEKIKKVREDGMQKYRDLIKQEEEVILEGIKEELKILTNGN